MKIISEASVFVTQDRQIFSPQLFDIGIKSCLRNIFFSNYHLYNLQKLICISVYICKRNI